MSFQSTRGDSCQFGPPRLSAVMDEPASVSHLGHVTEPSVVVALHDCGKSQKTGSCTLTPLQQKHILVGPVSEMLQLFLHNT